jgi:hypothetical protein
MSINVYIFDEFSPYNILVLWLLKESLILVCAKKKACNDVLVLYLCKVCEKSKAISIEDGNLGFGI